MRTYLVVIDESPESEIALRFAARRAVKTGGNVEILALTAAQEFVQWGGVMATIEEENRQRVDALVTRAAGTLFTESGIKPSITVREGDGAKVVREMIAANGEIAALGAGRGRERPAGDFGVALHRRGCGHAERAGDDHPGFAGCRGDRSAELRCDRRTFPADRGASCSSSR